MVVPQGELFTSLVHEVEDKLRVLTVFVGKDVLALEDRGVKACSSIGREAIPNNGFDLMTEVHFRRAIVASSLFYQSYESKLFLKRSYLCRL